MQLKIKWLISASCGLVSVALGAFGAHGLKSKVSVEVLEVFKTGVQYQMYHTIAMILVLILFEKYPINKQLSFSWLLFFIGICIFSGSLYAYTFTGYKFFGAITPIGGVSFMIGWLMFAIGMYKNHFKSSK